MRLRRHTGAGSSSIASSLAWLTASPGRRFLRDLGLLALTFVIGFGISSSWVSPGSVFSSSHAVPRVFDLAEAKAREKLTAAGFRPRIESDRPSPTVSRGRVIWQDPPPGMALPPNSVVQLVLSAGPAPVTVPDLIGLSLPSAERILGTAGMQRGSVDTIRGPQEAGVVLATRPAPGSGRPRGSSVDLVVSGGPGGGP
jgi:beta-lactam-binding protein with PASTA domain